MASEKQIAANRRNAQRSTGPTSTQGKEKIRLNALKHGLTAATVVLDGEDPAALDARVVAWKDELQPGGALEHYLVERAAHAAWQLDRADRTVAARINEQIRHRADDRLRREAEEVARLGYALFRDPHGPLPLYPHSRQTLHTRISWSRDPEPDLDPAAILPRLEATATGCRWLLDRWAELRAILADGRKWLPPDRFRAVRLLGKQPLDATDDERLLSIYLACRAMDPTGPSAFADVANELDAEDFRAFERRAEARGAKARTPADPAAGRAVLLAVIDRAVAGLEARLAGHRERESADRAAAAAGRAFDESPDAELLRRYQFASGRMFLRTVNTFFKVRKELACIAGDPAPESDESAPIVAVEPPDDVLDETKPISGADPEPVAFPPGEVGATDETKPIRGGTPPAEGPEGPGRYESSEGEAAEGLPGGPFELGDASAGRDEAGRAGGDLRVRDERREEPGASAEDRVEDPADQSEDDPAEDLEGDDDFDAAAWEAEKERTIESLVDALVASWKSPLRWGEGPGHGPAAGETRPGRGNPEQRRGSGKSGPAPGPPGEEARAPQGWRAHAMAGDGDPSSALRAPSPRWEKGTVDASAERDGPGGGGGRSPSPRVAEGGTG